MKVCREVAHGRVALGGPSRQGLQADPLELRRDRVVDLPRRAGLTGDDLEHHLLTRAASKRQPAGQQFVENDRQAEDVGSAVDQMTLAAGLLGTHVVGGAHDVRALADVFFLESQPEVGQTGDAAGVDQDVGRLDVAMEQVVGMGVMQGVGQGGDQLRRRGEAIADAHSSRCFRSPPSMYFDTTYQPPSSVRPTSYTGTMLG